MGTKQQIIRICKNINEKPWQSKRANGRMGNQTQTRKQKQKNINRFQCQIRRTHSNFERSHMSTVRIYGDRFPQFACTVYTEYRSHLHAALKQWQWHCPSVLCACGKTVKCHHKSMADDDKKPYAFSIVTRPIDVKGKINSRHSVVDVVHQCHCISYEPSGNIWLPISVIVNYWECYVDKRWRTDLLVSASWCVYKMAWRFGHLNVIRKTSRSSLSIVTV